MGFAYQAFPNTVLRGAFGIYYNLLPASYIGTAPFANLPFSGSQTFNNSTTNPPAFSMSNPFSATGAFTANPNVLAQAKTTTPYTEEYNLALERQFGSSWAVRIGYVGQHNVKQNNYGGSGNYAPNINLPLLPTPIKSGSGVTVQSLNQVQPFSAISLNMDPIFHSNMNSLQIGAHHQYHSGVAFGAEYQWTRVLGTENLENPSGFTPSDSYGPIAGIAPQVLTVNYSYLFPFGHGRALLSDATGFVDKLVSGWQISGHHGLPERAAVLGHLYGAWHLHGRQRQCVDEPCQRSCESRQRCRDLSLGQDEEAVVQSGSLCSTNECRRDPRRSLWQHRL